MFTIMYESFDGSTRHQSFAATSPLGMGIAGRKNHDFIYSFSCKYSSY